MADRWTISPTRCRPSSPTSGSTSSTSRRRRGVVRVTIDRDGGVDLDALAAANKAVSVELDRLDPMPGRYTLEVSSPGVERRLRTPAHFARAVGETVTVRTQPGTTEVRRLQGVLAAADDDGFVLETGDGPVRIAYGQIERARTVFEWGPTPAPGKGPKPAGAKGKVTTR